MKYGEVTFWKVATALHDFDGNLSGWAVTLFIRNIDWEPFMGDFAQALHREIALHSGGISTNPPSIQQSDQ